MSAALVVSLGLRWSGTFDAGTPLGFAQTILTTVGITTVIWLAATFMTAPEPESKLVDFYRRVRPAGPGWAPIAARASVAATPTGEQLLPNVINWVLGLVVVYSTLFAFGQMLFGTPLSAVGLGVLALACAVALSRRLA